MAIHPSEQIGLLLAETAGLWRVRLDRRLQPLGLSQAKWRVLLMLAHGGDDGLLQRELAESIGVEAPTMAGLLDRMEKEGWVLRRVRSDDRRCKSTVLTDRARDVVNRVLDEARAMRDEVCQELETSELQQCVDTLMRIKLRLQSL